MLRIFSPLLLLGVLLAPVNAQACSFRWNKGFSPDEIKEREDLRKVTGRFEVVDIEGTGDENGELLEGKIFGQLTTLRGTGWETWQSFSRFSLDCGAYRKPLGAGEGTFWISRSKVDGRYEILLWEGTYLPAQEDAKSSESDAQ